MPKVPVRSGATALAAGVTDAWNMIVGAALLGVIFFMPKGLIGFLRPAKKGDAA